MKQKLISNWNAIDFSIIWRRAKSWSAHPLLFPKPHCSSLKMRSTESLHRLRITEANTLPGTDNREIPRWFEHSDLFPLLLYNGTISATFQSSGRTSVDQHLSMMSQSHSTIPLCAFNISQEMLSGPLALPFFNLRTASSTSSNRIGLRSIDKLSAASSGSNLVLQLDVEGFRSWLKCSVQRSSRSSFVRKLTPVLETNLVNWGLQFRQICCDAPKTSFKLPLSAKLCTSWPLRSSHARLSARRAFPTSLQQFVNSNNATALLCFFNCRSARFRISSRESGEIQGLFTRLSGRRHFTAACFRAFRKFPRLLCIPKTALYSRNRRSYQDVTWPPAWISHALFHLAALQNWFWAWNMAF